MFRMKYKYLKPIEVNSIESEVLIINRVHCISQDTGLHLVLFFWQNLQLDVGITGNLNITHFHFCFLTLSCQKNLWLEDLYIC